VKPSENPYVSNNELTFEPIFKYDTFYIKHLTPIVYSSYKHWAQTQPCSVAWIHFKI